MTVDRSLEAQFAEAKARRRRSNVEPPAGPPHDGGMSDIPARVAVLEQIAKDTKDAITGLRAEIQDGRKEDRTRYLTLMVTIISTGIAVAGLVLAMQSNMLSAFQAGLSAVQAGSTQPAPVIIQMPSPPAPLPPSPPTLPQQ